MGTEAVDLDNGEAELKMHFTKTVQLMTPVALLTLTGR